MHKDDSPLMHNIEDERTRVGNVIPSPSSSQPFVLTDLVLANKKESKFLWNLNPLIWISFKICGDLSGTFYLFVDFKNINNKRMET